MGDLEYQEALKLGKKEYRDCVSIGKFPYLPVLDQILENEDVQTEQYLGLVDVPLDLVVGTSTAGRTVSFAANFMPILDIGTEFHFKWANLSDAQMNEGIRDPIVAYEFMNRYYVVEGNKRVSVLKYFKADSIQAVVTRKVPRLTEEMRIKMYYEFMKFYEVTGIVRLEFSVEGTAAKLLELVGIEGRWEDEQRTEFNSIIFRFANAFKAQGGESLRLQLGDVLTSFIEVYGYKNVVEMTPSEFKVNVSKCWNEFVLLTENKKVDLVMDPQKVVEKKSLLKQLLPFSTKKLKVAFLYPKAPEESDWIYPHELGRNYLEQTFPDQITTIQVSGVNEDNVESILNQVIRDGANIIFEVAPQMMAKSLKVAVENPKVKILNCSLNTPHRYIRTYYGRMYEAKFLSGMIAGTLAENDKIAYVADYPIYGMIANINAFALGVACTNPRAKVYLEWSTRKGYDLDKFLADNDIRYVSNQDMITPSDESREFGLYKVEDGKIINLVMPLWNWGIFYEKMIQSVIAGSYQQEDNYDARALNYWWGMSAGIIDLILSKNVPHGVRRIANHLRYDICKGDIAPFYGDIIAQDKTYKNKGEKEMRPEDIMTMDWLVENVIGTIPSITDLADDAKGIVELKGVEET